MVRLLVGGCWKRAVQEGGLRSGWPQHLSIQGDLIVDNLALRPSNVVAEYTGAPLDGITTTGAKTFAAISAGSTPNRAPAVEIFCKVEITQVGSLALAKAGGKSGTFLRHP